MSIRTKKYKKILQEVKYLRSELEYQEEVLSEYHHSFEEYYRSWCDTNNINIVEQEQKNPERIKNMIPDNVSEQKYDKENRIIPKQDIQNKLDAKKFNKLYKKIAMELHPDKSNGDSKKFLKASIAYKKGFWSILLEYAIELEIEPENLSELLPLLTKEAKEIRNKIEHNKGIYTWKFYECEDSQPCKDKLIKNFLKHLFKMEIK